MLLSVDPGLTRAGWALWLDGKLFACGTVSDKDAKGDPMQRARAQAMRVRDALPPRHMHRVSCVVCEWPQIYDARTGASKADPGKALLPLAGMCAAVAALFPLAEVKSYLPREWKGQVPKRGAAGANIIKARSERRLSPEERKTIPARLSHDGWDAIGIGLHHIGRDRSPVQRGGPVASLDT